MSVAEKEYRTWNKRTWKLEAIKRIKEYLKKEIGDMPVDRAVYIFG